VQSRRKAQESLRTAFHFLLFILVISFQLMTGADAGALEVLVSYSFPEVGEYAPPPASVVEGAILATFTGDEAISPIGDTVLPEQIDANTWTFKFPWDWTEPVEVSFVGSSGDTVFVVAAPEPVIPFDSVTHQLNVFHITTGREGLWSPATGIYVYGNYANFLQHGAQWERASQLDFYNQENGTSFSEPIGLRINGGWSRRFSQKSFRFYFDDYGAANEIEYDFFDGQPTTFQRLILRTHRFPFNIFNTSILESIWLDRGHLGSRMKPAVAYINNEYWGTYSLRERLDDEFLEVTHGIERDSYIFIKDGVVERGDPTDWSNLIASFDETQEYASHQWFADISNRIDLDTYVDWLLMNIFAATADNGFDENLAQLKQGDGPWKFIMWDEDDTFFPENLEADFFKFYSSENQAAFEANWPPVFYYQSWEPYLQLWCNMLRGFMQNSEFKEFFFTRLDELLANELSPVALASRVDAIVAQQGSEIELHAQRWQWDSASDFYDHAEQLKSFTAARHAIVQQQAEDFREQFRVPVELIAFEATEQGDQVQLTWTTHGESGNLGFMVLRDNPDNPSGDMVDIYYLNPELTGQGESDETVHYSTIDPSPRNGSLNRYRLVWFDQNHQGTELPWKSSAWVASWQGLVFNEIMADNDTTCADNQGEFDDWLEIFNGSSVTVNLDSLFITDDPTIPTRHQLTGGLQLNRGQHLVLWADGSIEQGADHLGFRLSSAGEGLYLFAPDGETLITSVVFDQQVTDVALARERDGSANWVYSAVATAGATNADPQTQSLLRLNELMILNNGLIADEYGEFDPWLEIFNPLPVPISLNNIELKSGGLYGGVWALPAIELAPGHVLLWLDGQPDQGPLHGPFTLSAESGSLELFYRDPDRSIDFLEWNDISLTGSMARIPDGTGPWNSDVIPTPGLANPQPVLSSALRINEFMAMNGSIIFDETGAFEDWVEIFNPSTEAIDLGGLFLTDDFSLPTRWAFPDTSIAGGQYLIVWCDSDPEDGPLHTNFKLSGNGESIGLYSYTDEVIMLVDSYSFGPQILDISEGRSVDGRSGRDGWEFFEVPSPGFTNSPLTGVSVAPGSITGLLPNYPNPFNPSTTIAFTLDHSDRVVLAVHDLRGRLIATLIEDWRVAGQHHVVWNGRGRRGEPVSSGVYLVRLEVGVQIDSRRILLLK